MRMSRRQGLLGGKMSVYGRLFSSTLLLGHDASDGEDLSLSTNGFDTTSPYYLFVMRATRNSIYKIVGTTKTLLKNSGSLAVDITVTNSTIFADQAGAWDGGNILAVRFPKYSDNEVQSLLNNASFSRKAYRDSSTPGSVITGSNVLVAGAVYLAAFSRSASGTLLNGVSFSLGETPTKPLFSIADNGTSMPTNAFLCMFNTQAEISGDGSTALSVNNGCICEIAEPTT